MVTKLSFVWKLVSFDKDTDSETVTVTIHIVDAGDVNNKDTVTKEFSWSKDRVKTTGYNA